jgi:hypothetical protein
VVVTIAISTTLVKVGHRQATAQAAIPG